MRFKPYLPLTALFLVWVLATWAFESFDLDRKITAAFYQPDQGGFYLENAQPFDWLYHQGTLLGPLWALSAGLFWVLGQFKSKWAPYRRQWLAVFMVAIVGAGIIVNGFLKDYWGRPRPRQVAEFGGHWQYRPIAEPGVPGKGKSFPCGHCTSGFLLVSAAVFLPTHPLPALVGVGLGLSYGALMSLTRIVQGAHFFSDAFWALGVILLSTGFFYLALIQGRSVAEAPPLSAKKRWALVLAACLCALLVVGAFLTRRPYFKTYHDPLPLDPKATQYELQLSEDPAQFRIDYKAIDRPILEVHAQGLGWTEATHRIRYWWSFDNETQTLKARFDPIHYFSEINHEVIFWLPLKRKDDLEVKVKFALEPPYK